MYRKFVNKVENYELENQHIDDNINKLSHRSAEAAKEYHDVAMHLEKANEDYAKGVEHEISKIESHLYRVTNLAYALQDRYNHRFEDDEIDMGEEPTEPVSPDNYFSESDLVTNINKLFKDATDTIIKCNNQ
jgi:hypothetical protein